MALLGQLTSASSFNDVAEAIIKEAIRRGYTLAECVAVLADAIQESGLKPGITSPNGAWIGIYQQDGGYANRNDPNANIQQFFDRLDVKRKSAGASSDIWKNIFWLQQRPGEKSADVAYANGRKAYLTEIQTQTAKAQALVNKYGGGVVVPDNRPDFNEYPIWSQNSSSRNGAKPTMFLLHTQEGDGNADSLAKYFTPASAVSYHYTISKGVNDDGVTAVDCVDTDEAAWSVGNANVQSINLCFAGSFAAQSRDDWLHKQGRAIDVAAYLAVQDAKKYGFSTLVVPPPYTAGKPGISDHMWVTKVFGWGTHTDVGPNFPWDVFAASVAKYAATPSTPVVTPPATGGFIYPTNDVMLREIWEQLRGPQGKGWPQLGGKSLVDYVSTLKAAA